MLYRQITDLTADESFLEQFLRERKINNLDIIKNDENPLEENEKEVIDSNSYGLVPRDNTKEVKRKLLPDVKIDWLRINNYGIHGKRI